MPPPSRLVLALMGAVLLAPAAATAAEPAAAPGTASCHDAAAPGRSADAGVEPVVPADRTGSTAAAGDPPAGSADGSSGSQAWTSSHGSTAMLDCPAPPAAR